ncbi:MAG: restriction endonuclease subunit S [Rhodocyclaceae bacterium]|nr:restriction endonuclease subunit S [Rhodocyclaceae bacterium]
MKAIYDTPLPDGWSEEPLAKVVVTRRGYTWEKADEVDRAEADTVPVIRIPNIQDTLDLTDLIHLRNVSPEALEKAAVTKDWLLFVGSNGTQDRIGDSVLIEENRPMVFASFLMGIQPKDQERLRSEFFAHWMRLHLVHEVFSKTSQQTTGLANFSWGAVKKLPVRFPVCVDEQRRIAAALKLADDAIQKARAELDATRELKRSLMNSLFVLGMPGRHTDFQDTKIGPIPQGWAVCTIRSVLADKPDSGTSPLSRPDPPGTPILNVSCVKNGVCSPAEVTYVDVSADEIERYRTQAGDFFVLRGNGNRDFVATGGLLRQTPDVDTIYSDKLIRLRFNAEDVADRFIPYLWQSWDFLTRLQSKAESGSGLWMMSKRDICREFFACPPPEEQKEIVALLDRTEEQLNAHNKKVEALMEVKRSLLQNLLTGKIRIPEGAIHA